jgi:hypothetical protein
MPNNYVDSGLFDVKISKLCNLLGLSWTSRSVPVEIRGFEFSYPIQPSGVSRSPTGAELGAANRKLTRGKMGVMMALHWKILAMVLGPPSASFGELQMEHVSVNFKMMLRATPFFSSI